MKPVDSDPYGEKLVQVLFCLSFSNILYAEVVMYDPLVLLEDSGFDFISSLVC